ncbi:MAG: hypothetical protein IJH04_05305 [Eggerthellaceae bacterium]|nr:hypothetical protein [Eggerthellaceae bacterium]
MVDEQRLKEIEKLERAFQAADDSAGADRAAITREAQRDAEDAVVKVDEAIAADEEAAEASRLAILAERSGNKKAAKKARAYERDARKKAKENHRAATKSAKAAYDAVRFSDPDGLGFLRIIMLLLGCNIVFTVFLLTTYIKGNYSIGFNEVLNMVNVLADGVTLWLIFKHKKFARAWVIAVSSFNIVVGTIFNVATGVFSPLAQFALSLFDIFILVYFLTSSRVKATLVEPFNSRTLNDDLDEEESFFRPKTWEFWRNLVVYFVIFSIVGHWMEAAVCLLIKYGIVPGIYDPTSQIWSDWLYPFPVYGIGFCACALLFYPLKNMLQRKFNRILPSLLISYVVSAFVCTLIEFALGMMTNQDLQLWDYSNMFCNFMGQVCLQNSLFFGFAATLMTWVVYPALERVFRRIPNESGTGVFIVAVVGFAVLAALYFINLPADQVLEPLRTITDLKDGAIDAVASGGASPSSGAAS